MTDILHKLNLVRDELVIATKGECKALSYISEIRAALEKAPKPKPATTEQIHDSREAFEKWHEPRTAQSNPFKRNPAKPDDYWCPMVQGLWETWQACEAQHKQKVRELVDRMHEQSIDGFHPAMAAELINKHFGE